MSVVGSCFSFDVALVGARGSGKTAFAEAWGSLLALDGYVRRADGTTPVLGAAPYEETVFTRVHHLSVVVPDCEAASAHRLFLHDTPGSLVRRGVAEGLLTRRTVSRRLNGAVLLVDGRPGASSAAAAEQRDGAVHFLRLAALHNVPLLVIHRGGPVPTSLMREGAEAAFVACAHDDLFEPTRALVSFVQQLHGICVTAQHVERSRVLAQAEARLHQRRMPPLLAPRRAQPFVCLPHHVPVAETSNLRAVALVGANASASLTTSTSYVANAPATPGTTAHAAGSDRIKHVYVGLFGSAACGKSAFLSALVDGSTLTHYEPTLQLTLGTCAFVFGDGSRCNVTLLDGPPNAIAKYLAKRQQRARRAQAERNETTALGIEPSSTPPSRPGSRQQKLPPLDASSPVEDLDSAGEGIADADAAGQIHTVGIFFVDASSLAGLAEAEACHREMLSVFRSTSAAPASTTTRGTDEPDGSSSGKPVLAGSKAGSSTLNSPGIAGRSHSHIGSVYAASSVSVNAWADRNLPPRVIGANREFFLTVDPGQQQESPPAHAAASATAVVPLPPLACPASSSTSRLVTLSSDAFKRARAEALEARRRVVSPELEPPARPMPIEAPNSDETADARRSPFQFLPLTVRHTFHHMAALPRPGVTLDALLPPLQAKAAPRASPSSPPPSTTCVTGASSSSSSPSTRATPAQAVSAMGERGGQGGGARARLAAALSTSAKLQAARAARAAAGAAGSNYGGGETTSGSDGSSGVEGLVATLVRHLAAVADAPLFGATQPNADNAAGRPELPAFISVAVTKENVDDFLSRPDVMAWTADVRAHYAGSVDPRANNAQLVFAIIAEYLETTRAAAARRRRESRTDAAAFGQATINELLEAALLSGSVAAAAAAAAGAASANCAPGATGLSGDDALATAEVQSAISRALRATFARVDRQGRGFISHDDAVTLVRDCDRAGVFDAALELAQATRRAPSSVNAHGAVTEDQFCAALCGMIARA